MKKDYGTNGNNGTDGNFINFRLFRYFRLFRNLSLPKKGDSSVSKGTDYSGHR